MAAAAAPADPLVDVRAVLTVVGLGANVNRFIASIPITSMDDFALMYDDDAKSIMETYNKSQARNNNVGFLTQKKLQGFLYWYHDKERRQEPIVAAEFTNAALAEALRAQRVEDSAKDTEVEIDVGAIDTDLGWWKWKEKLQSKLDNKLGITGIPLRRIIREDKPPGWTVAQATSDIERLIYQASLTGHDFDKDNATVWAELQSSTIGSPIYEWIRDCDDTKDGRTAFKRLEDMCEGADASNKRIVMANRALSLDHTNGGLFYSSEYSFKYSSYTTKLHEAYQTIARYRNDTAAETKVQRMLDGINVSNSIIITMAKSHVTDNLLGDWMGAVQYMSTKVTLEFPPTNSTKKRKFGGDGRRISQAGRGRGQGRGRGGRGRGRGGRGRGRGRGGGRHGNDLVYNGVDVSDYNRTFSNDEMSQMGYEGRNYVYAKRGENNNRGRGRGGRGYGGRGNGYEYQGRAQGRGQENDTRQVDQVTTNGDGDEANTNAIVPYQGNNTNANHRAAQGRGGRAGSGFGRGAHGRG